MLVTVFLGLWLIRMLVDVSPSVYVVVTLIATSVGVAGMLKEMIRGTMVPEIGAAFHSGDSEEFVRVFSNAFVLSFLAAVVSVGILVIFLAFLDKFSIPPELKNATAVFLVSRMLVTFLAILFAPATNMLPISNRMIAYNIWLVLERAAEVVSVLSCLLFFEPGTPSEFIYYYAVTSMIAMSGVILLWALHGYKCERRNPFQAASISRVSIAKIAKTVGWNGFVVVSMNLYFRFDLFLMNIVFGIFGTFVFGIATQIVNYSRQATIGLVQGMDAVVTRINAESSPETSTFKFVSQTCFLQATLVFSSLIVLLFNTETIFELWLGEKLDAYENSRELIKLICQIMLIGIAARSLSEGWMKCLSGVGEVRSYGPYLLIGALCNPALIAILYLMFNTDDKLLSIPIAFTALMTIIHLGILPSIVSGILGITIREVLNPLFLPLVLSIVISTILGASIYLFSLSGLWLLSLSLILTCGILGPLFFHGFVRLKV